MLTRTQEQTRAHAHAQPTPRAEAEAAAEVAQIVKKANESEVRHNPQRAIKTIFPTKYCLNSHSFMLKTSVARIDACILGGHMFFPSSHVTLD